MINYDANDPLGEFYRFQKIVKKYQNMLAQIKNGDFDNYFAAAEHAEIYRLYTLRTFIVTFFVVSSFALALIVLFIVPLPQFNLDNDWYKLIRLWIFIPVLIILFLIFNNIFLNPINDKLGKAIGSLVNKYPDILDPMYLSNRVSTPGSKKAAEIKWLEREIATNEASLRDCQEKIEYANRIFMQAEDMIIWKCPYCGTKVPRVKLNCVNCGSPKTENARIMLREYLK